MAQTKTNYDTFTAIAEPKRRELIELLAGNEVRVGEIVDRTQWNQPMVSKHLSVLKQVGLVSERKDGRFRVYRVNANELQPIQIWVAQFEKHWNKQLDHLDSYLKDIQKKGTEHE